MADVNFKADIQFSLLYDGNLMEASKDFFFPNLKVC